MVPFPDLVRDPQPWIGRILDHCGLSHEADCFNPHETKRFVTTASVTQVRERINTRGVGVAAPYSEWLGPFVYEYDAGAKLAL